MGLPATSAAGPEALADLPGGRYPYVMKKLLVLAVLAAVPASAQVTTSDQGADIAAAAAQMKALAKKMAPAAVDPKPVEALTDKLSSEGSQIEMSLGETGNALSRQTAPDARGRFRGIEANLVEVPPPADEDASGSMYRDLVMRRYFSRLEATSDDYAVDPKTGAGQVDEWHYVVSLDGRLLEVEHAVVPIEPVGQGVSSPNVAKGKAYRLAPSDPEVRKRWKKFSKELLTLGRTVEA
jgi:hypothetical protein